MNRSLTRRAILATSIPTAAIAATAGVSTGRPDTDRPMGPPTAPAEAFRVLIAGWRNARVRRMVAESKYLARPDDTRLEEMFRLADAEFLAIERHILDLTIRTVGTAPASVRVDDALVTVATLAGDIGEQLVAVVDLGRTAVLS